jgi:guanylate kinase
MSDHNRSGLLIILSSPSGAGKSSLAKLLREQDPSVRFSVSQTTRPPREGEIDGTDYYFCNREEFENAVSQGEMLEHAEVFGNLYGTPKGPVETALNEGVDVIFDVDWQGGQQIRASSLRDSVVSIFILPPSIAELDRRLRSRGQDADDVVARRMSLARDEISHWAEYDYVLVNENLHTCGNQLLSVVTAERLRRDRQIGLMDSVRELNTEFEAL